MEMRVASLLCYRCLRFAASICLSLAVVGAAEAAPLAATGFLSPVPTETDPQPAATLVAGGSPQAFNGFGFSGVLVSSVYRGNSFGPDALTFTYQLSNDGNSVNALHRLTVSSFENVLTDVSMQTGGIAPTLVDRSTTDVVGFSFLDGLGAGPLHPGQASPLLVVETNSLAFAPSSASVIDGSTAAVVSFAPLPAIPEPATIALAVAGLACVVVAGRRFGK
jgi:hypothetical protein